MVSGELASGLCQLLVTSLMTLGKLQTLLLPLFGKQKV